jgi:hypothetical protein
MAASRVLREAVLRRAARRDEADEDVEVFIKLLDDMRLGIEDELEIRKAGMTR